MNKQSNADRFTGFAELYDTARPSVPMYPINIICRYLGKNPNTVIDLGCGTGLSTSIWQSVCDNIIGVEPSADMLSIANLKSNSKMKFISAFADDTGLPCESADVAVCSQSFHWMEPFSTLCEVNRLLKPGGIFATIDCDWPPVVNYRAEKAYMELYTRVKDIEKNVPDVRDTFIRYSKDKHLDNIKSSGYFSYCRELLFSNTERCTAQRLIDLILSQGSTQTVLKKCRHLIADELEKFKNVITQAFDGQETDIEFCYRMRIGIK